MPLNTKRMLYRWICYAALMFIALALQTTVLSHFCIKNSSPAFIPFIVSAITLFEGGETGVTAGLVGGFLCDAVYFDHEGFYTIALPIIALIISIINKIMYWKNFGMSLLDWAITVLLLNTAHFCLFSLVSGVGSIADLLTVVITEILVTVVFTPFLYVIIKKSSRSFNTLEDL